MKKLSELAIPMTDEEYYSNDGTIHHSALASYAKGGFDCIPTLFDLKESEALLRGSIVDCMLTDTEETLHNKYMVANFPDLSIDIINVIKGLFNVYKDTYKSLDEISDNIISATMLEAGLYNNNWGAAARAKRCREGGTEYYNLLYLANGRTIVPTAMYQDCLNMVNALRNSPNTAFLYKENNLLEPDIERVFQPVFRETIDGITYTIKPDELVCLHDKKLIIATDLKTTGKPEYKFAQSFIDWGYSYQSRLYYKVVRQALDKDPYFKDFKLSNWYFVVVNKDKLNPLVWEDKDTTTSGSLYYGKNNQIEVRDPFELAKELKYYLENNSNVPLNISTSEPNSLQDWINKL
jgi:hypothetical protein